MKIMKVPKEFTVAKPVMEQLETAGFEAYFVGGSVRDLLLNKPIHDVDIATSAYPEEVKGIFPRTVDVGIEHGTVLVLHEEDQYEITTFRTESTYQDYRRPDEVTFVRSLEEDLKRRDFTINALAMSQTGEIVDLFSGMKDLESKLIRAVGEASERFNEDALRMMRAVRFASQLGFTIEEETLKAIELNKALLSKISIERVQIEWVKLLLGHDRKLGLVSFIDTGCYEFCPGFADKKEKLQLLCDTASVPFLNEAQAWMLTLCFLEINPGEVKRFLKKWKLSNNLMKRITLILAALNWRLENDWTNEWLFNVGKENASLVEHSMIYFNRPLDVLETEKRYDQLVIKTKQDLAVDGQMLISATGKSAGPWLGEMLNDIQLKVLNGDLSNNEADLLAYASKEC
ncbi:CCA tRNA nucleotidyltransferase [Vagococcus sp. PNs007]|uniref:CCA-adding enzyme n=1 Tax=Vagococcus proximus TaxID=2991417 RepID=A0ABT5X1V6_9ENTE|nr:CCA tRNA nucleotidyltransferase [Vagococcus proximus]MDF0479970.1 CCA tRNA nucleotidyltransferase [Vagococcus proximus]